jgi:ethanolaminephosphotransferase
MITAHVAQMPFPFIDLPVTFLLMSGWLLAKYEAIVEDAFYIVLDHRFILQIYLCLAAILYYHLASRVIHEICTYLDIGCLYIKKKK